ncbi:MULTISPECIES: TetR/AcrR family transcriptional regulator [Arthrobacter]|uniref:TetR/AcrR family transcriptional regulator n=1 Tax=unclassified Arthrobacter TaxID=235627 RepID=UPI0024B924D1|nr:TetR/AcrR family transcriptional regulator [Arthrobacter sp. H35-MC1]MDJ0316981.1 TetR/AcrR family transcriptional regulator [Arthrobacter sp. H35-MC1]
MTTQLSTRDRVLAAYEDLLISDGPQAATLDAVAASAGVSKGGLLYHFKSKEALIEALLAKLNEYAAIDFTAMAQDPYGCASYYIRTSVFGNTPFDRTIVAAMRLSQSEDERVREAFSELHARWYELILSDIGDPAVSRAVMLLGDGMYNNAALFGFPTGAKKHDDAQENMDVASLVAIVEKMRPSPRA